MSKAKMKDVTKALDDSGIEWYTTLNSDSINQIVARDNPELDFSTWFLVDENEDVEFKSEEDMADFFELYA
jgi:hypothetical protein